MSEREAGYDQPPGSGRNAPFANPQPSSLADAIESLTITVAGSPAMPLRVTQLTGQYGLVISDRTGAVVFDSAVGPAISSKQITPDRLAKMWQGDRAAVAVMIRTDVAWPVGIAIADGRILLSAVTLVGSSLDGIQIDSPGQASVVIRDGQIVLQSGYNVALTPGSEQDISLAVISGAGRGLLPACGAEADLEPIVRRLGGGTATAQGDYMLTTGDCFRLVPRTRMGAGALQLVPGEFDLFDDCSACCKCKDYAALFEAQATASKRLRALADRLNQAREKWNAAARSIGTRLECGKTQPTIQLTAVPMPDCSVQVAAGLCNNGDTEIPDATLTIEVTIVGGTEVPEQASSETCAVGYTYGLTRKGRAQDLAPVRRAITPWVPPSGRPPGLPPAADTQLGLPLGCVPAGGTRQGSVTIPNNKTGAEVIICVYWQNTNVPVICRTVTTACGAQGACNE